MRVDEHTFNLDDSPDFYRTADASGMPAYLESSNPANAAFYQGLGFEALGVICAGHSPSMVPMLRPAR